MGENRSRYISFLKENRTREQAEDIYRQRIDDARKVYEKFVDEFFERPCPICGGNQKMDLPKFDDRYQVVSCRSCTSIYVSPCPSMSALTYYYNECKCNAKLGSLLKSRAKNKGVILSERTESVVKLIKRMLAERDHLTVLEIGCNSGAFLDELSDGLEDLNMADQVSLIGIDIDKAAIENPVSERIRLFHASAEEFVQGKAGEFDLILHFELIEHLADPFAFMVSIRDLLRAGGATYFQTPNALGLDNQVLGYNDFRPLAHSIFPPMHLQAFTTQNITHFLLRAGLRLGEISTPGNFDVDMVRQFSDEQGAASFSELHKIDDEYALAVIQTLIKNLGASSHLAALAWKVN